MRQIKSKVGTLGNNQKGTAKKKMPSSKVTVTLISFSLKKEKKVKRKLFSLPFYEET